MGCTQSSEVKSSRASAESLERYQAWVQQLRGRKRDCADDGIVEIISVCDSDSDDDTTTMTRSRRKGANANGVKPSRNTSYSEGVSTSNLSINFYSKKKGMNLPHLKKLVESLPKDSLERRIVECTVQKARSDDEILEWYRDGHKLPGAHELLPLDDAPRTLAERTRFINLVRRSAEGAFMPLNSPQSPLLFRVPRNSLGANSLGSTMGDTAQRSECDDDRPIEIRPKALKPSSSHGTINDDGETDVSYVSSYGREVSFDSGSLSKQSSYFRFHHGAIESTTPFIIQEVDGHPFGVPCE